MKDKFNNSKDLYDYIKIYKNYKNDEYDCYTYIDKNLYVYGVDLAETEEERLAREKAEERSKKLDIILGE
jgi:hypothetical protein